MTNQTKQVALAAPTQKDFESVYKMIALAEKLSSLNTFEHGWDEDQCGSTKYATFSEQEARTINALAQRFERDTGALWRVIGAAAILMNPDNQIVDQDKDVIEFAPELVRRWDLVGKVEKDHLDGLKGPMIGEYETTIECECTACSFDFPDDNCEVCQGEQNYIRHVPIPWTDTKDIVTDALKHLGFKIE